LPTPLCNTFKIKSLQSIPSYKISENHDNQSHQRSI
jgi:hypothetical protein